MTGIDSYSVTPATNATADGGAINWAEGQPPSSVNNSARQETADIRAAFNDLVWFVYGTGDQGAGNIAVPSVYASTTSFTIAGANVTTVYHAGRRVRAVGVSTGTIYGSISSSSFSTNTTVTVIWDSGSLSNETLVISLSQNPVTGYPICANAIVGTKTNNDAAAGNLGEYTSATGGDVAMTSGSYITVISLSLTAGDWNVWGSIADDSSTNPSSIIATITTTNNGNDGWPAGGAWTRKSVAGLTNPEIESFFVGQRRYSLASTTTIYLTCRYDKASGAEGQVKGFLAARRVR